MDLVIRTNSIRNIGGLVIRKIKAIPVFVRLSKHIIGVSLSGIPDNETPLYLYSYEPLEWNSNDCSYTDSLSWLKHLWVKQNKWQISYSFVKYLFPKRDETNSFEQKYITNPSSKLNIAPYFNNYKIKIMNKWKHV